MSETIIWKIITQKQLKELVIYDPTTGIFIWTEKERGRRFKKQVGRIHTSGHLRVKLFGSFYYLHRLAWFYVHGKWPKDKLDHKDHIRYHNWIGNLREATNIVNGRNRKLNLNNTTGFIGIRLTPSKKWKAGIKVDGNNIHLGTFKYKKDAIAIRKKANKKYGFYKNHGK